MSAKKPRFIAMGIVVALLLLAVFSSPANAETTNTEVPTTTTPVTGPRVELPFNELLPGIHVACDWWNETGQDQGYYITPAYPDMPPITPNDTTVITWTNPAEESGPWGYPLFQPFYYAEDIHGNPYWIHETCEYQFSSNWSLSNLLVIIILDPDGSYMSWLSHTSYQTEPAVADYFGYFTSPDNSVLTGDEVFIYSTFYLSQFESYNFYRANYTWYDESLTAIDPDAVIPILAEEYQWVSWMNESYEFEYEDSFTGYGFDVNEMFFEGETVQWMDHYFDGLTAFNDTNHNGIMDVVFDPVSVDYNEDDIPDLVYYELNETASEIVYNFYPDDAEIGTIQLPQLNSNGQIEWSAEVTGISGRLVENYLNPIAHVYGPEDDPFVYAEPESIPVMVDRLEMVYRFEVTDDAAVMKIDQHFGDFTEPSTDVIHPALEGLSLAAKYSSYFSGYTLYDNYYGATVTEGFVMPTGETGVDVQPQVVESAEVLDGILEFGEAMSDRSRTSVEFGGLYIWGKDNQNYEVGTAIIPNYYYVLPVEMGAPSAELVYDTGALISSSFYYASCYAKWDGYAITHDPIFTVFPLYAPGSISWLITALTNYSVLIGAVGIVAIAAVCVRVNAERKRV
ncbi:MAG: hypothetical protein EAX95_03475 [Candidatus Thorarchaeota archaeon]|nr:hypothetical protein [Candidatus Thorarchaeota archaeon]